ncbi:MAG: hypothetical protein ABI183_07610 [Polyangiaceae bacterium]
MFRRVSYSVGTVIALGALQGCSSSSNSSAPSSSDAGAADSGSTATGTMSVLVIATTDDAPGAPPPSFAAIPGAQVSIDMPGGGQQTATSDANGKVTFTGIDWTLGSAGILGTLTGYGAYGIADVNPTNFKSIPTVTAVQGQADVVLTLAPVSAALATLTATLQNKADAANYVFASATLGGSTADVNTPTATLPIGTTAPYTLITHEFTNGGTGRNSVLTGVRWASYSEPQATGATQAVTVDLAGAGTTLTPTTTHTHAVVPGGATGSLNQSYYSTQVFSVESGFHLVLGHAVSSTLTADSSAFDVVNENVSIAGQTPVTQYVLYDASGGAASAVSVDGLPQDNATISNFLTPPSLAVGSVSLSQPIVFTNADPTTISSLIVTTAASTIDALLVVDVPPGVTTIHPPTLPAALTAKITGAKGTIYSRTDLDAVTDRYARLAVSRPFGVRP